MLFPVRMGVGITQFSSFNMIEWQYLFAASLLATIPVVILFMTILLFSAGQAVRPFSGQTRRGLSRAGFPYFSRYALSRYSASRCPG